MFQSLFRWLLIGELSLLVLLNRQRLKQRECFRVHFEGEKKQHNVNEVEEN